MKMRGDMFWMAGVISTAMIAGGAAAQNAATSSPVTSPIPPRPVDPAVGDVNPLSASLRDMRVDLRQPTGFENVYRVPGRPDMFMRSSGALNAVFPQSAYAQTAGGPLPIIPAGTVFYIGEPPQAKAAAPSAEKEQLPPGAVSNRVRTLRENFVGAINDPYINHHVSGDPAPQRQPQAPDDGLPRHTQRIVPDMSKAMGSTIANDEGYRVRRIGDLLAQAARAAEQTPR
jgi:hypothetical protein